MGKITLKELSKLLGISVSSVSKALNDSHEISAETKKKVKALAEKHQYQPNILAKSLKTGKSNTIGIIIPYLANPFQSQILEGAHQAAYANNYKLVFMQSRENAKLEEESLFALQHQNIDGIIISPCANSNLDFIAKINQSFPIVLIDRIEFDLHTHKIGVDSERGAYEATQHLIDMGREQIIVLNGQNIGVAEKRLSGYKKALMANYIDYNEKLIIHVDYGQSRQDLIKNLKATLITTLSNLEKPIGLFGTTDTLTISVLGILSELNIRVPEDIAVIGFANTEAADSMNPSLSAVVQPAIEMGYKGVEKLIELIESKNRENITPEIIKLNPSLVLRNSTKV